MEKKGFLNVTWIDKNKLILTFSDLEENKNKTIEISNNNIISSYFLSIFIYGKDKISDNIYSISPSIYIY